MIIVVLGFIIFALFNPMWGSWVYIGFITLFELYIFSLNSSKITVDIKSNKYTEAEVKAIEQYTVFFKFPLTSRNYSALCSGISMSAFILVPWLFFNKLYIQAIIIGLNYFITGKLAVLLNPQLFFHHEDNKFKGIDRLSVECMHNNANMKTIDSVLLKMYSSTTSKKKSQRKVK